jgi:cell division protein FtsB
MQGLVSRIAIGVFGLMTVAMLLLAIFDERGALALQERRQELENLNKEIEKAIEDNNNFRKTIEELRHDPKAIERIGREEFKLLKPGEIMIELPDTSTPSKEDQSKQKERLNEQK